MGLLSSGEYSSGVSMVQNDDGLIGLGNIIAGAREYVQKTAEGFTVDLYDELVRRTPIDTGKARASWKIGINEELEDVPPYIGGVQIEQTYRKRNRFLSQPRQGRALSSFVGGGVGKSTNIVISSNVPYMARLNRGWSKQAPPNFIEACVDWALVKWNLI